MKLWERNEKWESPATRGEDIMSVHLLPDGLGSRIIWGVRLQPTVTERGDDWETAERNAREALDVAFPGARAVLSIQDWTWRDSTGELTRELRVTCWPRISEVRWMVSVSRMAWKSPRRRTPATHPIATSYHSESGSASSWEDGLARGRSVLDALVALPFPSL